MWIMEVQIQTPTGKEWLAVRPTGELSPYTYLTQEEARLMLKACYPDQYRVGDGVRVREQTPTERLECLRVELRAERLSWGEVAELQSLLPHIAPDDVELLEAAGQEEA